MLGSTIFSTIGETFDQSIRIRCSNETSEIGHKAILTFNAWFINRFPLSEGIIFHPEWSDPIRRAIKNEA